MELYARPGWERVLKPKGYVKTHVQLDKEIIVLILTIILCITNFITLEYYSRAELYRMISNQV